MRKYAPEKADQIFWIGQEDFVMHKKVPIKKQLGNPIEFVKISHLKI